MTKGPNREAQEVYTPEQINDAKKLLDIIDSVPPERRSFVISMASAFMDGMETQRILSEEQKAIRHSSSFSGPVGCRE